MNNGIGLYDVKDGEEFVHSWEYIQIGKWNNHRLYYKPHPPLADDKNPEYKSGYRFHFLSFMSGPVHHNNDLWTHQTEVEIAAKGYGYWDGIRHIWIKPEDGDHTGYLYYNNVLMWSEFFQQLRKLEEVFCRENEGDIW